MPRTLPSTIRDAIAPLCGHACMRRATAPAGPRRFVQQHARAIRERRGSTRSTCGRWESIRALPRRVGAPEQLLSALTFTQNMSHPLPMDFQMQTSLLGALPRSEVGWWCRSQRLLTDDSFGQIRFSFIAMAHVSQSSGMNTLPDSQTVSQEMLS